MRVFFRSMASGVGAVVGIALGVAIIRLSADALDIGIEAVANRMEKSDGASENSHEGVR